MACAIRFRRGGAPARDSLPHRYQDGRRTASPTTRHRRDHPPPGPAHHRRPGGFPVQGRRIDELAKKDYVRKAVDPADKRRINVEITSRSSGIVDLFIGRFKASIGGLLEAVGAPQIGR
jgi:hypothetical protein